MLGHPLTTLSPRELQVIALMAEGLANKIIAKRLGIRPATVKGYAETIYRKLGVGTRTAAVVTWITSTDTGQDSSQGDH